MSQVVIHDLENKLLICASFIFLKSPVSNDQQGKKIVHSIVIAAET
jgi:hypothetical protein